MIVGDPMTKQTAEKWPWSVDFSDVLDSSSPVETISAATFTATLLPDGSDATVALQNGEPDLSGSTVAVELQDGAHGSDYMLQIQVTTDRGHVFEAERLLRVRDIPEPVIDLSP